MSKLTETELAMVKDTYNEATLLRDTVHVAFKNAGLTMTPLTLMLAAVQEFHEVCVGHGDLAPTRDAFAAQCGEMATAAGTMQYALAQMIATATSDASASFNEVPAGAFVVPGPSEPQ